MKEIIDGYKLGGETHRLLFDYSDKWHTHFFLTTQHITDATQLINRELFLKQMSRPEYLYDYDPNMGINSEK